MSKLNVKSLALAATLVIGLSAALTGLAEARAGGGGGGGGGSATGELSLALPETSPLVVPNRGNVVSNQATSTTQCFSLRPTRHRQCDRFLGY